MTEFFPQILAAISPAIIILIILLQKDKRPEPVRWLLLAVLLGMLVCPAVLLLAFLGWPDIEADSFLGALMSSFVSAAIPEECLKFLALYLLVKKCKYFDEMFDGVVYAVCIGMGFAAVENILYLTTADINWFIVGIARALLSVPAHYFFAVIMGAFFSLGWFDKSKRKYYLGLALVIPIIVHGIYDTFCFSMNIDESLSTILLLLFLVGFKYLRRYVRTLTNSMLKMDGYEEIS